MAKYKVSYDHATSSYGEPVLLDDNGNPCGPADVGLWGNLPPDFCGRVDLSWQTGEPVPPVYWSRYGEEPDRMWRALKTALRNHPNYTHVNIESPSRVILSA